MAIPNFDVPQGETRILHSGPEDASNDPVTPAGPIVWTFADPGSAQLGTLTPQGPLHVDCAFASPAAGPLGIATITATGPQVANPTVGQCTCTVIAGALDHFAFTADLPTPTP